MKYFSTKHHIGEAFRSPETEGGHTWTLVSSEVVTFGLGLMLICLWQRNEDA